MIARLQREQSKSQDNTETKATFQHRYRSGRHETQLPALIQSLHQSSCRRRRRKRWRQCRLHQDVPGEQGLPGRRNWTLKDGLAKIKSAECLTCCQPHPICHPRSCHLLVVGTWHTLILNYYGLQLHYCSLYNSVPVDLVQTIKDSCHLCEEFCANVVTLNQITWTADKVLRRWGSWFCTGRNPPDSESWQSTRNWIIPSLGKWRIWATKLTQKTMLSPIHIGESIHEIHTGNTPVHAIHSQELWHCIFKVIRILAIPER